MPDHVVLVADAVAPQHVPAFACNGQSLSAVVPLQQGDNLGHHLALFLQTTKLEARMQAKGDLSDCIRQLLLDQLVGCQRSSKLVPAHSVVSGLIHTELGSSEGPPCNSIASVIQARERTLEADHIGQHVLLWHCNLVHEDHASVGSPQGELALDLWCREAWHPLLKNEAPESSLTMISSSVSLHSRLRASLKSKRGFGSNFLAGLGSAGGEEAEVVEAMLLQPDLTTFEIAFEVSAILIRLNPVPPPLIRGSLPCT